ncbi:MAG: lipocalin-like domain-containing protein [Opitutaceae bacterium]
MASMLPAAEPALLPRTVDDFAVPQPGRSFVFPRDHGSHPEFRIEWWYLTGHLWSDAGKRYGFQATFFRQAGPRENHPESRGGAFGSSDLYLAHSALLDIASGQFLHEERLNREGWDAFSSTETLDLQNGNWSLTMVDSSEERMHLLASVRAEASLNLELVPAKPKIFFGRDGVSRKGSDPTAASHYITFPRLNVSGVLTIEGAEVAVTGQAWMDHEISSSQLSGGQVGWDWVSIQLEDGREIMAYRLRLEDGRSDPFSTLAWVGSDGMVTHLGVDQFQWEALDWWQSPQTGGRYPIAYRLRTTDPVTDREVVFEVRPLARVQELSGGIGGIAYWEGAGRVLDEAGKEVGSAYTELTGYAESMEGRL